MNFLFFLGLIALALSQSSDYESEVSFDFESQLSFEESADFEDSSEEAQLAHYTLKQEAKKQCYVKKIQHRGDRLDNPIFEGGNFAGTMTFKDCKRACETQKDSKGRKCVAFEMSDGGRALGAHEKVPCALAWGCDYVKNWWGGSVFRLPKPSTSTCADIGRWARHCAKWKSRGLCTKNRNVKKYCCKTCSTPEYQCAIEHFRTKCTCTGTVYYGKRCRDGNKKRCKEGGYDFAKKYKMESKEANGSIRCTNSVFGDPVPGHYKACFCKPKTKQNSKTAECVPGKVNMCSSRPTNLRSCYQYAKRTHGLKWHGVTRTPCNAFKNKGDLCIIDTRFKTVAWNKASNDKHSPCNCRWKIAKC